MRGGSGNDVNGGSFLFFFFSPSSRPNSLSSNLPTPRTGSPIGLFLALRQVNPTAGRGLGTPGAAALMPGAWALLSPLPAHDAAAAAESTTAAAATDESTTAAAAAAESTTAAVHSSSSSRPPRRRVYYDGLPACRRMYNLYHPFDPIAYRVEPLAASFAGGPSAAPRAVFAARAGGSRLHVGLREAAEDVGGALVSGAAALGGALAAGIRSLRTVGAIAAMTVAGRGGGGGGGNDDEDNSSNSNNDGGNNNDNAPASSSSSLPSIRFARVAPASARAAAAAEAAADAAALAAAERARGAGSAVERLTGGVPLAVGGGGAGGAGAAPPQSPSPPGTTAAAAAAGAPPPPPSSAPPSSAAAVTGSARTARGRLDFQLQTGATENQYLSALSSHFGYWGSADVGLFVLRAVRGVDVRAGGAVPAPESVGALAAPHPPISSPSSSPTRRAQEKQQQKQEDRRAAAQGAPA